MTDHSSSNSVQKSGTSTRGQNVNAAPAKRTYKGSGATMRSGTAYASGMVNSGNYNGAGISLHAVDMADGVVNRYHRRSR